MNHQLLPDFIVIGAMKCATTTLHDQLSRQPGLFMSRPKEPNFFSDDANYAKGFDWYARFFEGADKEDLRGESSTHYTKLPTHPRTLERMVPALPRVKLIYVMRHPIDRLTSHYLHEQTVGRTLASLTEAIGRYPELVDYGRYGMQLEPYLRTYGPESVLPVFFERLVTTPQVELERIGKFLGCSSPLGWDHSLKPRNVGRERLRKSAVREFLVQAPVLSTLRRRLIPRPLVEPLKSLWMVNTDPPPVPDDLAGQLRELFDRDLARLGAWLGMPLSCDTFREAACSGDPEWSGLKPRKSKIL